MRKVFLDNLPRWDEKSRYNGKVKWKDCVGYRVKFIYDDIEDEFEIIEVNNEMDQNIKVKYNANIKNMNVRNIRNCKLGVLIGKQPEYLEFKHEINEIIKTKNSELKLIEKIIINGMKYYKYECSFCGNVDKLREYSLDSGTGCNVCANKKVAKGKNDLWTTHPEVAKLLKDAQVGYNITYGTSLYQTFVCPVCKYEDDKMVKNVINFGVSCPRCSDGISYPTKFMISTLDQIGTDYKVEETFEWSKQKRYDFYIPSLNCIIEMHGEQHYKNSFKCVGSRTLAEEQENDKLKEELAKVNGIENYMIINCYYSNMEYISNNIIESKLSCFLDLNIVDWNLCNKFSSESMVKKVCNLWSEEFDNTSKISKEVKLDRNTVINYLKRGTELGWCNYNPKEAKRKASSAVGKKRAINIVQLSLDGQYIKTWNSASDVKKELNILDSKIGEVCKGKRKTAGGFGWMYIDEYEKRKGNITPVKVGVSREIVQLLSDGQFIEEFPSISEANRITGISVTNISRACVNKRKSCGFKWMYKEDYENSLKEVM